MLLVKMAELPKSSDRIATNVSTGRPSIKLDVAEVYRMDRNFRGTKLSRLQKFEDFRGLNFRGCQL